MYTEESILTRINNGPLYAIGCNILSAGVGRGRGDTENSGTEASTGCIISAADEYETLVG